MIWKFQPPPQPRVRELIEVLEISPTLARILVNRGFTQTGSARRFLEPRPSDMYDPGLMLDMDKAVDRLARAFLKKEKIFIFGDYDVDGVTSIAALSTLLDAARLPFQTHQPNRLREGYGLNEGSVDLARKAGRPLLFGAIHAWFKNQKEVTLCNSAYLMSPTGEIVDRYDKIHLVLFSEYLPLKNTLNFLKRLVPANFGTLTPGIRGTVFTVGPGRFGVAICYEDTMSERIRDIKRAGCDFALNITNDAWFRASEELEQHLAISVFLAVESRIGLFRNGNTGISASISPTGRIVSTAPRDTACTYTEWVWRTKATSLYARYGDWFAWCAIFASVFGLLRAAFGAKRKW